MKMYHIETIAPLESEKATGVGIGLYTGMLSALEKQKPGMTLDDLEGHCVLFVDKGASWKLASAQFWSGPVKSEFTNKTVQVFVMKEKDLQEFQGPKGAVLYAKVCQGQLWINADRSALEEQAQKSEVSAVSEDAKAALQWLETGRVGLSSGCLCAHLFPELRAHHKLSEEAGQVHHPWDGADFERCVRFLEAVPGAKGRLQEAKDLGAVWSRLVDSWGELEELLKSDKKACSDKIRVLVRPSGPKM